MGDRERGRQPTLSQKCKLSEPAASRPLHRACSVCASFGLPDARRQPTGNPRRVVFPLRSELAPQPRFFVQDHPQVESNHQNQQINDKSDRPVKQRPWPSQMPSQADLLRSHLYRLHIVSLVALADAKD